MLDAWLADLERTGGPEKTAHARRLAAAREPLGDRAAEERVFVVPRASIEDGAGWSGVRTEASRCSSQPSSGRAGTSRGRRMEADPSFKQVIPYLVLRDGERYFLMRRTRAVVDARLHDRWSIGVGGHLNPGDGGGSARCAGSGRRSSSRTSSRSSASSAC